MDFENIRFGLLIFLGILNVPVYWYLGKIFFGDLATLWGLVKTAMIPDAVSLFRGRYWEDWAATVRINLYFLLCAGLLFVEYYAVVKYIYGAE